jgi:hypothetical protein
VKISERERQQWKVIEENGKKELGSVKNIS